MFQVNKRSGRTAMKFFCALMVILINSTIFSYEKVWTQEIIEVQNSSEEEEKDDERINPYPDLSSDPNIIIGRARILSTFEFWLSLIVLVFGCIVIYVEYMLLQKRESSSEDIMKTFVVTLIIIGTLFSVTAGFDAQQVAPAMGLFGTIAGYVLGRSDRRED